VPIDGPVSGSPDAVPFPDAPPRIDAVPPPDSPPGTYRLTVTISGSGTGSVDLGGLKTCTIGCVLDVAPSTNVVFTATPDVTSLFGAYSGDCAGSSCSASMTQDRAVDVRFDLKPPFTLNASAIDDQTMAPDGSVTFSPAGNSCGAGCATFAGGTNVTLHATAGIPGSWAGGGCEPFYGQDCTITDVNATITASICTGDYAVSQAGSDSNPGSCALPFHTMTHAFSVAGSGQVIRVFPGTYDTAYGETMPLTVPAGVTVLGEIFTRGAGVIPTYVDDRGGPDAESFWPQDGAGIRGFKITPGAGEAVWTAANNILIDRITATGSTATALYIAGGATWIIRDSVISGNGEAIAFVYNGTTSLVEKNTITNNAIGIELDSGGEDLGGGGQGSVGQNVISCNTTNDVWTNQFPNITAHNDYWDHVPPDTTQDFNNSGTTSVLDSTGAMLAASPCP
jgi:hypothetical protein